MPSIYNLARYLPRGITWQVTTAPWFCSYVVLLTQFLLSLAWELHCICRFCLLFPLPGDRLATGFGYILGAFSLFSSSVFRGVSSCFPSLEGKLFQLSIMLRHFLCHFLSVHADLMAVCGSTMTYLLIASSRPFPMVALAFTAVRLLAFCCLRLACTFLLTCTFWIDSNCLSIFSTFCVIYMSMVFHTSFFGSTFPYSAFLLLGYLIAWLILIHMVILFEWFSAALFYYFGSVVLRTPIA